MPPAKKFLGTMPEAMQFDTMERCPKSAEVDRPPDLERRRQLLPDFEEHGRKHPTAAEKVGQRLVLASASFKPSGGPHRHH